VDTGGAAEGVADLKDEHRMEKAHEMKNRTKAVIWIIDKVF